MITEFLSSHTDEIKLGLVDSQIDSIRRKTVTETAARVYRDGHIGIASAIGATDEAALAEKAAGALRFEMPYPPPAPGEATSDTEVEGPHSQEGLIALTEDVLSQLRAEFPGFVFSHGVHATREVSTFRDSFGRSLRHAVSTTTIAMVVKERGSPNIIDTFVAEQAPTLTAEDFLASARRHLAAFQQRVSLPAARADGKHRVVMMGARGVLGQAFSRELTAPQYGTGASMFSGKLGERLFSERLTVLDSRDWRRWPVEPFDAEGTVRDTLDHALIRDGVFCGIAANRRDAALFGLPATGSAIGSLENTPSSGLTSVDLAPTAPDLATLLEGEEGLLVWMSSGGDITRTGDIGAPSSVILRVAADGTPIGQVPAGTLTGNLYQMLGDDFVGVSEETVSPMSASRYLVTHMTLQR